MEIDEIVSLRKFKADTKKYVKRLRERQSPIVLTENDDAVAVVQSVEDYKRLLEAVAFLKLMAPAERDIQEGRLSENEEVFDRVIKKLRNGLGKPQDA